MVLKKTKRIRKKKIYNKLIKKNNTKKKKIKKLNYKTKKYNFKSKGGSSQKKNITKTKSSNLKKSDTSNLKSTQSAASIKSFRKHVIKRTRSNHSENEADKKYDKEFFMKEFTKGDINTKIGINKTFKLLSLQIHPDKDEGNQYAKENFQILIECKNSLIKDLENDLIKILFTRLFETCTKRK
tara:strand:- start:1321 stop:1869 length:549 start_codon:yes stop_codon:yes gene_type:complete